MTISRAFEALAGRVVTSAKNDRRCGRRSFVLLSTFIDNPSSSHNVVDTIHSLLALLYLSSTRSLPWFARVTLASFHSTQASGRQFICSRADTLPHYTSTVCPHFHHGSCPPRPAHPTRICTSNCPQRPRPIPSDRVRNPAHSRS